MELALPWEKPFQHLRPHGVIIGVKGKELWSGRLGPFGLLASRKKSPFPGFIFPPCSLITLCKDPKDEYYTGKSQGIGKPHSQEIIRSEILKTNLERAIFTISHFYRTGPI